MKLNLDKLLFLSFYFSNFPFYGLATTHGESFDPLHFSISLLIIPLAGSALLKLQGDGIQVITARAALCGALWLFKTTTRKKEKEKHFLVGLRLVGSRGG